MSILIIGSGPAGLTLAIELKKRAIDVRIIDEKSGPSAESKALAIQGHTLEIFDKMGVLKEFLEKGNRIFGLTYHHEGKECHFAIEGVRSQFPFVLLLPQSETEQILQKKLSSLGVEVEWNTTLIDFNTLKKNGKREKINYEWIVGADGAHSQVRHLLNIPFLGSAYAETFILADIECESQLSHSEPNVFLNKEGLLLLIPFGKKGTFRVIMPIEEQFQLDELNLEDMMQKKGCDKVLLSKIVWKSSFHVQRRQSVTMHKKKIFLTGDSAHVHSPIGGQGMNLSIQDSYNLGWKLAYVMQNKSSRSILNSYESERKPIAKKLLSMTTLATKLFTSGKKFSPLLFSLFSFLVKSKRLREKISNGLAERTNHYRKSSLSLPSRGQGVQSGDLLFDVALEKGRLFDHLTSHDFTLILFKENEFFQKSLIAEYGSVIVQKVIADSHFMHLYQATSDEYLLVRPDGYIASRGKTSDLQRLEKFLKKLFRPLSNKFRVDL